MGRKEEALNHLLGGNDPTAIAPLMKVSLATVLGYLDRKIGDGDLRRSDIYFSLDPETRRNPPNSDYVKILDRYRNGASAYGDMYEDLRSIEVSLHRGLRDRLASTFGEHEGEWWRKGVPTKVRVKCASRREEDDAGYCEAYGYTDLLDLAEIIKAAWGSVREMFPPTVQHDRPELLRGLRRLNQIRRRVMHPVRGAPPGEDDFEFVREFKMRLDL
jgi:hypothetical protein